MHMSSLSWLSFFLLFCLSSADSVDSLLHPRRHGKHSGFLFDINMTRTRVYMDALYLILHWLHCRDGHRVGFYRMPERHALDTPLNRKRPMCNARLDRIVHALYSQSNALEELDSPQRVEVDCPIAKIHRIGMSSSLVPVIESLLISTQTLQ